MMNMPGGGGVSRDRRSSIVPTDDRSGAAQKENDGGRRSSATSIDAGLQGKSGDIEVEKSVFQDIPAMESTARNVLTSTSRQNVMSSAAQITAGGASAATPSQRANTDSSKKSTSLEPPVTKQTLSELDVNKIVHNPKLRHDINFDPELHFRPNLDGDKGKRKQARADAFWTSMRRQLELFLTNREAFEAEVNGQEWCLPSTLCAIRGILETLVPQRDRASVEEIVNVELLMQQFTKGVADLGKLAQWLSQLLKSHCAPMRDPWVDQMVVSLSSGDKNRDVAELVQGMRQLLGVLEAMKLDVANHQIRCLRPLLIEDTVHFETRFFCRRITSGKLDTTRAREWYRPFLLQQQMQNVPTPNGELWAFFDAFLSTLQPSRRTTQIPQTFQFDEDRIVKFRSDLLDAVNLEVCDRLFLLVDADVRRSMAPIPRSYSPALSDSSSPYMRTPASDEDLSGPRIPSSTDFVDSRHRRPDALAYLSNELDSPARSATSSPALTTSNTPSNSSLCTPYLPRSTSQISPADLASVQFTLRQSIIAILEDCPDSSDRRWQIQAPAIALEILRTAHAPLHQLANFEPCLQQLSNPGFALFQNAEQLVLSQLRPLVQQLVTSYQPLSSLQIFEAATSPRATPYSRFPALNALHDIATRLVHIGTLHWRVWAPLAYLDLEDESDSQGRAGNGGDETMGVENTSADGADMSKDRGSRPRSQRQGSMSEIPTRS